jgi:hypothetical protein
MKKSLISALALLACTLGHAAIDTTTYKISSDGASNFRAEFVLTDQNQYSVQTTQNLITSCNEFGITNKNLSTGVQILLQRPVAIKADDANLVNVTLTKSTLPSVREVETSTCTVQLPVWNSFTASANVMLPVGTKKLIAKDATTGERWFIERTK